MFITLLKYDPFVTVSWSKETINVTKKIDFQVDVKRRASNRKERAENKIKPYLRH